MNIIKTHKSFNEQINKLKSRNLTIENEQEAEFFLQTISYNRFSSYRFHFLKNPQNDKETYKDNTTFQDIQNIILADSEISMLIFSILREIELTLRTQISYHFTQKDPHFYIDINNFNNQKKTNALIQNLKFPNIYEPTSFTSAFIYKIDKKTNNSKSSCENCKNYICNNKNHFQHFWSAVENIDFGTLIDIYELSNQMQEKQSIAKFFDVNTPSDLTKILSDLKRLRNIIAHHDKIITRFKFRTLKQESQKIISNSSTSISDFVKNDKISFIPYYLLLKFFIKHIYYNQKSKNIINIINKISKILQNNLSFIYLTHSREIVTLLKNNILNEI
jgi:abortive infection bacteriophage resistance protein